MGAELLKECSELWVFGQPSEGMKEEIELAKRIGIPVRYFNTVLSVNNETVNSEPNTSDKTQQQEGNTHE